MPSHFVIMYYPPRDGFAENASPAETAAVEEHFHYLKKHNDDKVLLMAGRIEDARFGLALLKVADQKEAERIVQNDPAVKAGVFRAELLPFRLALGEF